MDRLVAVVTGSQRSEFTYDGFSRRVQIVEKVGGTVTGTRKFLWVGNLYYTRDHLGNLRELTDNTTTRARYEYDPYGRRSANLITGGSALEADWGFTGHYYHAQSGLHLAWFRAYDANLGRWISRDPIAEDGGLNTYAYVFNDPVGYLDPLGLFKWISGTFAALGVVGGVFMISAGLAAASPLIGIGLIAGGATAMVLGLLKWDAATRDVSTCLPSNALGLAGRGSNRPDYRGWFT